MNNYIYVCSIEVIDLILKAAGSRSSDGSRSVLLEINNSLRLAFEPRLLL